MLYQIVINSSLKHHTFILLQLWRLEFQNECQSCQQGWLFLEAPGRICACLFQHPEAASISWLLTPPSHQSGLCFPLIKTPGDFQPPDCYESPLVSGFGSWQPWQIGRGEERKTWKDMSRILVCSALVSWNSHRQRKSVPSGHFFFFGGGGCLCQILSSAPRYWFGQFLVLHLSLLSWYPALTMSLLSLHPPLHLAQCPQGSSASWPVQ